MGFLNAAIQEIDQTEPQKKEITETLDFLMSLCKLKGETYEAKIKEDLRTGKIEGNDGLFLPITHTLKSKTEYRCFAENGISDVAKKTGESLKKLFKDTTPENVIDGLSGIVTDAISVLVGTGQGTENETTLYSCCIDGSGKLPVFVRIDMMIWCRNIATESIKKKIESAFSLVFFKSALDVTKVEFTEFCSLYLDVLDRGFSDDIPDEEKEQKILETIKAAKEIYDALRGEEKENKVFTIEDLRKITPKKLSKFTRLV